MKKTTLKNTMTKGEKIFGWIWLFAQQLVVPVIVVIPILLLRLPLSDLWLHFILFAINFSVTVLCFRKFLGKSLRQLGKRFWRFVGFVLLGMLLYWLSSVVVSTAIILLVPDYTNANNDYITSMAGQQYWVMFVSTVLLVPIAEEVTYRGLIFGTIYRKNHAAAYILSAVIFSAVHVVGYILTESPTFLLVSFLQYLPAGLVLAWVYAKTDSIFAPVLIHTANNLIAMMVMR